MRFKFLVISLFVIFLSGPVLAQDSGFGIGGIVGSPTGISLKLWVSKTSAFDAGITWSFYNNGSINVHADYLWHKFKLIPTDDGKLPLYFGIGPKLGFGDDFQLGVRVPVGAAYMFRTVPIDIFVEAAPSVMFLPETTFQFDGGLGARYFF